jgi:ABC-type Fe3+/spermidine/putrescine transport system ATPase subunit
VAQAELLLLDEPLSNLDARLRQTMRDEIQTLLRATGVTAVAVTHDQADALAISDRVVVMSAGRVIQQGSPQEIFERPVSSTVAHFLGSGSLVPGRIVGGANVDGLVSFRPDGSDQAFPALASVPTGAASQPLVAVIPASAVVPEGAGVPLTTLSGEVRSCQYAGGVWDLHVRLDGGHAISLRSPTPAAAGTAWSWQLPSHAIRLILNDESSDGGNAAANPLT